ncbi:MAG TPA: tetratricopeptide repeat protein [Phycisphaerales bacterium]|nr:tetratricopeptide repeat protein [Phycisphaerales bacterium]
MSTTSPAYIAARKLYDQGRLDDARQSLQRALQRSPADPDLNLLMGGVLVEIGQPESAVYFLERAAAAAPSSASARAVLGEAYMYSGKLDSAIKSLEHAISIDPSLYSSRINLGNIFIKKGRLDDAERSLREAAELRPDRFEAANNLALLQLDSGRADQAAAFIRARLRARPGDAAISRCLANILNYVDQEHPGERLAAHRAFGDALIAAARDANPPLPSLPAPPRPEGRIRIAYMSPDFREHSVAYFIEPILRNHDRTRFELFGYSSTASPDERTRTISGLFDTWRDVARINDVAVTRQLRTDGVDILIDLAGLTNNHRLGVLALRGAPVQMTYCGYPATTGLSTVDYRLVDEITDPAGSEEDAAEKLLRIPGPGSFSCYQPPDNLPAVIPFNPEAPITLGSFNVLSKVNVHVVQTWAAILKLLPGSKLLLKARSFSEQTVQDRYRAAFESHGIDPSRLELLGPLPSVAEHLALYSRVTLALDPFPYNGTTTTYEALSMGVPVVTLMGSAHAGRVGASILTNLGETSLIARTHDQYLSIVCTLARDAARLAMYRSNLRDRLFNSPLCRADNFTRRFERVLLGTLR